MSAASRRQERWLIRGRVQGVWFRAFTQQRAKALGLTGWVRNLPDGRVETVVLGSSEQLAELEGELRKGPPAARVDGIDREEVPGSDSTTAGFEIRQTPPHVDHS